MNESANVNANVNAAVANLSDEDLDVLRSLFDPSSMANRREYVNSDEELDLASVLRDPSRIDKMTDAEADAYYAEGNRIFCGGTYDYMVVNSPYDAKGEQYAGVKDPVRREWTSKAGLKQMADDFAILGAAANGAGELNAYLNVSLGKPLGWSAEQYAKASVEEKAARILENGDITLGREFKTGFANWWSSWDLYSLGQSMKDRPAGSAGSGTPEYETLRWDWQDADGEGVRSDAVGRAMALGGVAKDGSAITFSAERDFAEYVYGKSKNHTLVMPNGDTFSATLTGRDKETGLAKYNLELARGGKSEYDAAIIAFYENRLENQRNAMNGIAMRQIFNENPDVLRYYLKYDESRKGNKGGMFSRRGDVDAIISSFAEECRPYMRPDAELTQDEIAKRDHYTLTFQQLCHVLALDDKREGFRIYGNNAASTFAAGAGNIALEWWGEAWGLAGDAYHNIKTAYKYAGGDTPAERYFNQFMSWAEADIRGVTKPETFSQDTTIGLFGGEAAKLAAFSHVMKVGKIGTLAGAAGKAVSTAGRAAKIQALVRIGNSLKRGARVFGGAAKPVGGEAVGFRKVDVPTGKKPPKGAVMLDGAYYVRQTIKGGKGNFFAEHNAKVEKLDRQLKRAVDERKAQLADFTKKKTATTSDELGEMYGDLINQYSTEISKLEADIARNIGTRYMPISAWALDIANELPAIATVALAMNDTHKAMGAYSIGERFAVAKDAKGKAVSATFDAGAYEIVKEYALYDSAGNAMFLFHVPKGLQMMADGRIGTQPAQGAARNILGGIEKAVAEGDANYAAAIVAALDVAIRKNGAMAAIGRGIKNRARGAAHLAGTGIAMNEVATVVANAEERRLADRSDKAVFTPGDFALNEEQAIEALKGGGMMAAGGLALGEAGYVGRMLAAKRMPYLEAFNHVKASGRLDAMSRDAWMLAVGMAHRGWKIPLKPEEISGDPLTASMQLRREAIKAQGEYERVSSDTYDYISRAVDSLARKTLGKGGEGLADIRMDAAREYGEEYARIFDGIIEHIKTARLGDFGVAYATEKAVEYGAVKDGVKFEDFSGLEVAQGLRKFLGVDNVHVDTKGDGAFSVRLKATRNGGETEIRFRKADLESDLRRVSDSGLVTFSRGWANDVMDGLEGKDPQNFTEETYGELMRRVSSLDDSAKARLRGGEDVDGILTAAQELGATATGRFFIDVNGSKIVEMTERGGILHITDFIHEGAHGFIASLRESGYFADGKENLLRERFGDNWEEAFVRQVVETGEEAVLADFAAEGMAKLQERPVLAKAVSAVAKLARRLVAHRNAVKNPESGLEAMLDKKVADAKAAVEAERKEAETDVVRKELEERLVKTEAQTALVPSRLPVPDSVFMEGVAPEARKARERELNESGFYYDSNLNVWVNEHSAPRLYHNAVYNVVARKTRLGTDTPSFSVAADLWAEMGKAKADAERARIAKRIRAAASPERLTEAERKHVGIVKDENGRVVGIAVNKTGDIAQGGEVAVEGGSSVEMRDGWRIEPFDEADYAKWAVRTMRRKIAEKAAEKSKEAPLIATHNTTPWFALAMFESDIAGGISTGLTKPTSQNRNFGSVTFFVSKADIDPKLNPWSVLYKGDVGTTSFPDELSGDKKAVREYFHSAKEYDLQTPTIGKRKVAKLATLRSPANYPLLWETPTGKHNEPFVGEYGMVFPPESLQYFEAKNYDTKSPTDLFRVALLPKFSDEFLLKHAYSMNTDPDLESVAEAAKKMNLTTEEAMAAIQRLRAKDPAAYIKMFNPSKKRGYDALDRLEAAVRSAGIPIEYYECDQNDVMEDHYALLNEKSTLSRQNAFSRVLAKYGKERELVFNVVGSVGASRFFGKSYASVRDRIDNIIAEATRKADDGTRKGLVSSKNAKVNAIISSSANSATVGPFAIHVGGVDGDKHVRLEYEGGKIRIPKAFLERSKQGERFQIAAFLNRKDKVFEVAYPEIADSFVVFSGDMDTSTGKRVKEPAWQDDNTFILNNSDGQIVVRRDRWNPRLAPDQFAQSLIGLVQSVEGWEERIRASDARVAEALVPSRAKRTGSGLAVWLADERLIQSENVGRIVEKAVNDRLGKNGIGRTEADKKLLSKISEAIWGEIRDSVRQFAGEAEARFLASRFGLTERELLDYSNAEEALKNTLATVDSANLTSAQQTKKVLEYWNAVILKAVDAAIYGRNITKAGERTATIRKEFADAISEEMFSTIVNNILRGTRAVRTRAEAEASGTPVGGKSLAETGVDGTGDVVWDASAGGDGRTLATSGMRVVNAVDARIARNADLKWIREKAAAVDEIVAIVAEVKKALAKDPSKAQSLQEHLVKEAYKVVEKHSNTKDPVMSRVFLNSAISEATEKSRWRVVSRRRSPEQLLTEAAAARLVRSLLKGVKGDKGDGVMRKWVEERVKKIGIPASMSQAVVARIVERATMIAYSLRGRVNADDSDVKVIKEVEAAVARRMMTDRILHGAMFGQAVGRHGADAEHRAIGEAKRLQAKLVEDARGIGVAELSFLLGRDIVGDIENLAKVYGNGDGLAKKLIETFADRAIREDERFAGMSYEEFASSTVARAELARTASAWLREVGRRLGYGQVREWAMREAARLQSENPTFGAVHMTVAKYADMLSDSLNRQSTSRLVDEIEKQIDKYADGNKALSVKIPDYERKVAPRVQEYWRYAKKAMRMTDAQVAAEASKCANILKLTDAELLELGGKTAGEIGNEATIERDNAVMRYNILTRFGGLKNRSFAEAMDIYGSTIAKDLAGAVQEYAIRRNARLADDAAVRQAFVGELTSIRRSLKGDDFNAEKNGSRGGSFLAFSVADLFRRMGIYLHEGSAAHSFLVRFRQDMSIGHIKEVNFVSRWEGEMRLACKNIYGKNFESAIPDLMLKRPEYDRFSRSGWYIPEGGEKVKVGDKNVVKALPPDGSVPTNLPNHLSKANLIYIYAASQQADMQANNFIWGRDAKYLQELRDAIGPQGVAMAHWLTTAYAEIRKELSPISEKVCGMPILSPDERYCPLAFEGDEVSIDERRFSSNPFPGFLTRRVTHDTLRLKETTDAFRMFEGRIQDSGHYLGFAEIIDRMNTTLKHPKVQTAYAQLYGKKAKDDIYAQLADALNGGRKSADTLMTGVRNFITATSLMGNVGSALKQLEGVGGWAVEMGIGPWLKGLARNPMTSAEVREGLRELIDAGLFRTREQEGISEAMVTLLNSCDGVPEGPMSRGYNWYKKHGMDVTKWVDKFASMTMAGQYYVGRRNWYIEHGLKVEDAKVRALADTDYAIQTTQQSGRAEFLHSAQRAGTAGKLLTQFSGPAFVRWGIECETLHRAAVMGDRGAWGKLASRLIALHLICPSLLTLAGSLSQIIFKREDEKNKELVEKTKKDIIANCLSGPLGGWFIYGQILNAAAYETVMPSVRPSRSVSHFEVPVLSKLNSLRRMTLKIFKDVVEAAPWNYFSRREQRLIAEDAWRLFQMLFPAAKLKDAARNAGELIDALE